MSRFVKPFLKAQRLNKRVTPSPWIPKFLETSKEPSIPFPLKEKIKIIMIHITCAIEHLHKQSKNPFFMRNIQFQPKRIDLSFYMNLKEGDLVEILFGKDQGRQGIILKLNRKNNNAIVQGCNLERKRLRVSTDSDSSTTIVEIPIHVTNLALVDPVLKRPTRVKTRTQLDGSILRLCKDSGCALPEPLPPKNRVVNADSIQMDRKLKSEGPTMKEEYSIYPNSHFQILKRISEKIIHKNSRISNS